MRSPRAKTRFGLLLWLAAAGAVLGTVVALAAFRGEREPPGYRRYVSPPLPDGTRYTLLHPAALAPTNRTARSVNFFKPPDSFVASVRKVVPLLLGGRPRPERSEFITVIHGPLKERERGLPGSRRDVEGAAGGHEASREVHVVDARAKARFVLFHVVRSQANDRREVRIGRAVADSFRILPPGVPPRAPR